MLQKQLDDYASQNEDWRQIARHHIFTYINERLSAIKEAHHNLPIICEQIDAQSQQEIGPDWCRVHQSWLAAEFLRYADAGESVRPFFGSWHDLQGYKQTGYFLGYELVKILKEDLTLRDIALLEDFSTPLRKLLEQIAA